MGAQSTEDEAWNYARALLATAMDVETHDGWLLEQFTAAASWALEPLVGTEVSVAGAADAAARLRALLVGLLAVAGVSLTVAANNDGSGPGAPDVGIRRSMILEAILRQQDEVSGG